MRNIQEILNDLYTCAKDADFLCSDPNVSEDQREITREIISAVESITAKQVGQYANMDEAPDLHT